MDNVYLFRQFVLSRDKYCVRRVNVSGRDVNPTERPSDHCSAAEWLLSLCTENPFCDQEVAPPESTTSLYVYSHLLLTELMCDHLCKGV